MSLSRRTLQAGGQRLEPGTPACCPPVHPGVLRGRTMGRSSHRPDWRRSAVGPSSYPLLELRSASGTTASRGTLASSPNSRGANGAVGSHAWLTACVRNIVTVVGQPGRGPMLQLVFSSRSSTGNVQHRFETVPVSQSLADNPTRWNEFSEHVRSSGANGLVLVRPISSPDKHCVYAAAAAAQGQPSPSPAACTPCMSAADGPCTVDASPKADMITGQVGDCCGGDNTGDSAFQSPPASRQQPQRPQQAAAPGAAALAAALPLGRGGARGQGACDEAPTQYYGLVVQGSASSEADGCWVLKTTRSDLGGVPGLCSCTHFSLTRVCLGQPLYSQLRDAWLVR